MTQVSLFRKKCISISPSCQLGLA